MKRAALALLAVAAGPTAIGPLWRGPAGAVAVTACPRTVDGWDDGWCRAIAVEQGGRAVPLGAGYQSVRLLWQRRSGGTGPDALVLGNNGGSGGAGDLFAVSFDPHPIVRKLSGERMDGVTVHAGPGPVRLDLAFNIEFFNGAAHGGVTIARLPVRWAGDNFVVDRAALTCQAFSRGELDFRTLAVRQELSQWAEDAFPARRLYPPAARSGTEVTARALLELILAGRAGEARALLHRAWPRDRKQIDRALGGEDAFWAALCRAVVGHPLWRRFGLARLPQGDLVQAAAKGRA